MSTSTSTAPLALAALVALPVLVGGCGRPELPPAASPGPLVGCEVTEEPGVRTWQCGELLALELAADPASGQDVRAVLEDFARGFAANAVTRSDAPYGKYKFPSVRLEGQTPAGQPFVAQMVVVTTHETARVVQCASRNPIAPCEPVLEHLVGAP